MVAHEMLLLDSSIRDWVVLPLLLMVVLVGMGRHYTSQLIKTDVKVEEKDLNEMRYKQSLMISQRLRTRSGFISPGAFNKRKLYLNKKGSGVLRQKGLPGAANPMSNPMAMMDMMKGNMTFMIPNFAMMAFVNFFFSGFVCLKVPFPMPSTRFKVMLQRGVDLTSLDVSYVSSLCMYFLLTFGLNGIYKLILGENELDNMQMQGMGGMGGMAMGAPGQMGFDAGAAFKQEREIMSIYKHNWTYADLAEKQLLGDLYPKKKSASASLLDMSNLGNLENKKTQ